MNIIQWCNSNVGFINAVLSISTLIISIIAVYISIKLAYIPYKKSILINHAFGMKYDKYYLELVIANSGNKLISINDITVKYKDTYIGGSDKKKFIEPSKTRKYFIDMDLRYEETKYDKNAAVTIELSDTEGKKYKFKVGLAFG